MPSFSTGLEESIRRALDYANERNHDYATLEHLLLSLIDERDAAAVMRACNVDLDELRARLIGHVDHELESLIGSDADVAETKVTQVIDFARQHQHPLQCTMEKE